MSETVAPQPAGQTVCPYCRATFEPEDVVKLCPACGTPHHADCFAENGGCTIFGCTAAPADDPKISVTPTDFHPAQPAAQPVYQQGSSFYNLNAPLPYRAEDAAAPPPPRPPGSSAPPPPLTATPYATTPYAMTGPYGQQPYAYAYDNYVRPKSRVAFVLLAVFLGAFGGHNFYAGYTKKAVIQLCVTVFTCFWASLPMWIWAIVEACTVNMDDDGVLLN